MYVLAVSTCVVLFGGQIFSAVAEEQDPLLIALSSRESAVSVAKLEEIAGGADALVSRLLVLRHQETPPFAGTRAEKILLLSYASRPEVSAALSEDVNSESYVGLARVVAANIQDVPDKASRYTLAKELIRRGKNDTSFSMYIKHLTTSGDPEMRKLATQ